MSTGTRKPAALTGAAADLFATPDESPETHLKAAEAKAERLFEEVRELFYDICLKHGLAEAERVFAKQPNLILTNKQRERVNKMLIEDALVLKPELKKMKANAQANHLFNWYKRVSRNGGTPEYREMMALLSVIVREPNAQLPNRGKQRYSRTSKEGIRKSLGRPKKK